MQVTKIMTAAVCASAILWLGACTKHDDAATGGDNSAGQTTNQSGTGTTTGQGSDMSSGSTGGEVPGTATGTGTDNTSGTDTGTATPNTPPPDSGTNNSGSTNGG